MQVEHNLPTRFHQGDHLHPNKTHYQDCSSKWHLAGWKMVNVGPFLNMSNRNLYANKQIKFQVESALSFKVDSIEKGGKVTQSPLSTNCLLKYFGSLANGNST